MPNAKPAEPRNTALTHSTFEVERTYPQAPERVFRAFAEKDIVRRWRIEDENCQVHEFTFDFRIGGSEVSRFSFGTGPEIRLDAQFQDIVANERIVFSYRMAAADAPLSVSLTSIVLTRTVSGGTHLMHTEHGVYFNEPDAAKHREDGCRFLMENLAKALKEDS